MFALGLSYFLTDYAFPMDFEIAATEAYGVEEATQFMSDIEEAAEAIEDMGLESVQNYLSAYHLSLETGIQLVTVEYDMAEGTSKVTFTA
jgi:hypothetical protein